MTVSTPPPGFFGDMGPVFQVPPPTPAADPFVPIPRPEWVSSSDPYWSQFTQAGEFGAENPYGSTIAGLQGLNNWQSVARQLGYQGPFETQVISSDTAEGGGGYATAPAPEFLQFIEQKKAEGYDFVVKGDEVDKSTSTFGLKTPTGDVVAQRKATAGGFGEFFKEFVLPVAATIIGIPGYGNQIVQSLGSSVLPAGAAESIGGALGLSADAVTSAVGRGIVNAGMSTITGGDTGDVLKAGALPLAGAGVSSVVSDVVPSSLGALEKAAERAVTAGVMGELSGKKDFGDAVVGSLTGSAIGATSETLGLPPSVVRGALDIATTGRVDPIGALTAASDLARQTATGRQIERAYSDPSRALDVIQGTQAQADVDAIGEGGEVFGQDFADYTEEDGNLETDYVVVDRGVVVDRDGNPIMGSGTVIDSAGNPMNVVYPLDEDYAVTDRGDIISSAGELSPVIPESVVVEASRLPQDGFVVDRSFSTMDSGMPDRSQGDYVSTFDLSDQIAREGQAADADQELYLTATSPYEQARTETTEGDYGASTLELLENLTGVPGEISPGRGMEGVVTSTGDIVDQGGNVIASPTTTTTTTPAITTTTAPRATRTTAAPQLPGSEPAVKTDPYKATFLAPFIVGGEAPKEFKSALSGFLQGAMKGDFLPTRPQERPEEKKPLEAEDFFKGTFAYSPQAPNSLEVYKPEEEYTGLFNFRSGGMVPLMAQGGTRYGDNAHGALRVLEHSGKHRVDYRQGDAVTGIGDGQSDDIPAMLADGEFVIPADVVAALGNGSTKAGSDKLYEMMHNIRRHHRSTGPKDLPPPAKPPLEYIKRRRDR